MARTDGLPAEGKIELLARTLERRVSILPVVTEIGQSGLTATVRLGTRRAGRELAGLVAAASARRGAAVLARGNAVVLDASAASSETELCRLVAVLASSIAEVAVGRMPAAA